LSTFSNPLTEYSPQMEFASEPSMELEGESGAGLFDELQEMELAVRLLDVVNDAQLDRFLHDVVQEAETTSGAGVPSSNARTLNQALQTAVHQIWQRTGMEDGTTNRGGSVGAEFGRRLSSMAGPILGLELEGLSAEDREFEAARQFVRFAGEAVRNVLTRERGTHPHDAAHQAVTEAAEIYAPGLNVPLNRTPRRRGRWIACDDRIILLEA
jgi:hypothetical protein